MGACLLAAPLKSQADSVYLQMATDFYQLASTNNNPATSPWGLRADILLYANQFIRGQSYRSEVQEFSYQPYLYNSANGLDRYEDALDYTSHARTNLTEYPWVNGWLSLGTNMDSIVDVESRWLPSEGGWTTWTNTFTANSNNNEYPVPDMSWTSGFYGYLGASYAFETVSEPASDGGTVASTTKIAIEQVVHLATSAPSNTTGSALFKLTSGFGIPGATNENVLADFAGAYTLAGETPDNNGVVWKTFADGTNHDVSVRIRSTHTNAVTNFTFNPTPTRVQLTGLKWRGTNDTNWTAFSGPLHVLVGTTVEFQVQVNETNVNWPTNMPAWSNGSNQVEQVSITFNTVSADTNGQWISVTAGNTVSNQVVIYDFSIVAQGQDIEFSESPRSLYGVGEKVDFTAGFTPAALSNSFPLTFTWFGQGSASTNGFDPEDISRLVGQVLSAGCQAESFTVTAALASGLNAGTSRATNVSIIAPRNAILLPIKLTGVNENPTVSNTNVGHTQFTHSCTKRAYYQLQPDTVSFKGVSISEGIAPYSWVGGGGNVSGAIYYNGVWTNANPGPLSNLSDHAQGGWLGIMHLPEASYYNIAVGHDTFGVPAGQGGLPIATYQGQECIFSPSPAKTNTVSIPLAYRLAVKTNVFITIDSTKAFGPEGSTTIKKDGLGPITKGFGEDDSPVE